MAGRRGARAVGLPAPVRRALAGKPVQTDGQRLDPDVQLLLKLMALEGMSLRAPDPARARAMLDRGAVVGVVPRAREAMAAAVGALSTGFAMAIAARSETG